MVGNTWGKSTRNGRFSSALSGWKVRRFVTETLDALWVGWLFGDEEDREALEALGVEGPMLWRPSDNSGEKGGVFEHCWVRPEAYDILVEGWPAFAATFSLLQGKDLNEYQAQAPVEAEPWR
jgi:hypothetical protein